MALINSDKTKCRLCGKLLLGTDEIVGFPSFLPSHHELAEFSDAAFHKICFENAPEHEAVERLYHRYREIWESRPRNLKNLEEIEAWGQEAFKDFP
jgi:hypothetical protein